MIVWCYGLPWWLRPVKNLPAMQETRLQSLGQEDTLEKGMATHSRFLPGESHGQRSPGGCTLWSCKELDTNEQLKHTHYVTYTTWWLSGKESACQCRRQVQSLHQEDRLEKEMAIYSSILAREILWAEKLVGYSPWGCKRVGWLSDIITITTLHRANHNLLNSFPIRCWSCFQLFIVMNNVYN